MFEQSLVDKLRERYSTVHPLIFHRSIEYARNPGDLFDILETIPNEYPIIWDEISTSWQHTEDLTQEKAFEIFNNEADE